jgi:predicted ATP-grasp superfamily ATP-dependent carboligase
LARQAVAVVPGLAGYVGVDVILGDAADGSRDWVIEINPRLTTSYVGLRALCQDNLAERMLRVIQGLDAPALSWKPGPIRFTPEGRII